MKVGPPSPNELLEAAKASPQAFTEWEVAFHEAGHVVVEVATGSFPDEVWLNLDGARGDDHAGRTRSRSYLGAEVWATEPLLEPTAERAAVTLFAGDLATAIAIGHRIDLGEVVWQVLDGDDHESTDSAALRRLVSHLSDAAAESWLEARAAEAEAILRDRWADVERVAAELVEHRRLDREALQDLLPEP